MTSALAQVLLYSPELWQATAQRVQKAGHWDIT